MANDPVDEWLELNKEVLLEMHKTLVNIVCRKSAFMEWLEDKDEEHT